MQISHPFAPPPAFSFGKSSRRDQSLILPSIGSGPAKYNVAFNIISKGSNFSMYSARNSQFIASNDTPGVGAYSIYTPKQTPSKQPSRTISKSMKTIIPSIPGPGQYDLSGAEIKGGRISKSKRTLLQIDTSTPGVGCYNLPSNSSRIEHSIPQSGARLNKYKALEMPGPASYSPNKSRQNTGVRISSSHRDWAYMKSVGGHDSPSPGHYFKQEGVQQKKQQKTRNSSISLKQLKAPQVRNSSSQVTELNPFIKAQERGKLPRSFLQGKRKFEFMDVFNSPFPTVRSPGPKYAIQRGPQSQKCATFGSSKRDMFVQLTDGPGVGQYTCESKFGKKYERKRLRVMKKEFSLKNINLTEAD